MKERLTEKQKLKIAKDHERKINQQSNIEWTVRTIGQGNRNSRNRI